MERSHETRQNAVADQRVNGGSMQNQYINIMIESLRRKLAVLDAVLECSKGQKALIEDPNLEPEEFEKDVRKKAELIEKLEQLDEGFDSLYQKVKGELQENKEQYAAEIGTMQELIKKITETSAEIQVTEARNKEYVEAKFASVRKQARKIRNSQKVVQEYYRNMQKLNYVDPQFTDKKK